MRRWVPRPVDLAAAAVLTVGDPGRAVGSIPTRPCRWPRWSASYAVGTAAVAWHRLAPMTALVVALTGARRRPRGARRRPGGLVRLVRRGVRRHGVRRLPRAPARRRAGDRTRPARAQHRAAEGLVVADIAFAWMLARRRLARRPGGRHPHPPGRAVRAACRAGRAAGAVAGRRRRRRGAAADRPRDARRDLAQRQRHDPARQRGPPPAPPRPGRGARGARGGRAHRPGVPGRDAPDARRAPVGARTASAAPRPGSTACRSCSTPPGGPACDAELTIGGTRRPLPPGVDLAAYRIVQEAVTNVLRHAAARRLDCTVDYGDACVELPSSTTARGAPPPAPGGHGLVGHAGAGGAVRRLGRRGAAAGRRVRACTPSCRCRTPRETRPDDRARDAP